MANTTNINDKIYWSYRDVGRGDEPLTAQAVTLGDSPSIDAFARLRVSNGVVVFDAFEIDAKKTFIWTETNTGAATTAHVANQSAVQYNMSAATGDKNRRASKKLTLYTPGTSIMLLATCVMGVGAVNSRQRIGMFNATNGVFFEQKDTVMGVVVRSYTTGSAVDNRIDRDEWNIDPMDGTGPSGVNLDFTKTQIFYIDLEWLGVGRVRCGFVHQGIPYICHEFYHNNSLTKVYMSTPLLPVAYETENVGVSTALTDFRQICCSVIVEGSSSSQPEIRSVNCGVTAKATTTTTATPLLAIRLQTAAVGSTMLKPVDMGFLAVGNRDHLFEVWYGGTLESASWVANSGHAAFDVAATHITGAIKISSLYTATNVRGNTHVWEHLYFLGESQVAGQPEILTVTARSIGGGGSALARLDYEEYD